MNINLKKTILAFNQEALKNSQTGELVLAYEAIIDCLFAPMQSPQPVATIDRLGLLVSKIIDNPEEIDLTPEDLQICELRVSEVLSTKNPFLAWRLLSILRSSND